MFAMDISQIPLFAMLRGRLGYLAERQRVIAENVANSDTPGFLPKDLKPFSFDAQVQNLRQPEGGPTAVDGPVTTQPGHMSLAGSSGGAKAKYKSATTR